MKKLALHVDYFEDALDALLAIINDISLAKESLDKIQQGTPISNYFEKLETSLDLVYTRLLYMVEEVDDIPTTSPTKEDLN